MTYTKSSELPKEDGYYWIEYRIKSFYSMEQVDDFIKNPKSWELELEEYRSRSYKKIVELSFEEVIFFERNCYGKNIVHERRDFDHFRFELLAWCKIEKPEGGG